MHSFNRPEPRRVRGLGLALALAIGLLPIEAQAINGERYLVCREDREPARTPSPENAQAGSRRRVKRRPPPPLLAPAPTPVIDVPMSDPLPSRPEPGREPVRLATIHTPARQDFRCTGFVRGESGILAVLSAPPGTKFAEHPHTTSWIIDNMEAAGSARLSSAAPYLRRELGRIIPETAPAHVRLDRLRLKVAAAQALADLGDFDGIGPVLQLVKEREDQDFPGYWEDALEALSRLDRRLTDSYARDLLDRAARSPGFDVAEQNRVRRALPLLTDRSADAVGVLTRLSSAIDDDPDSPGKHLTCLVLAARIRAGDEALAKVVRPELATDLRTQRAVQCYSELMPAAFPGDDPSEVDTLLFRHRYEELVRLVRRIRVERHGGSDAADREAVGKIRAWLANRAKDPDIADAASRGIPARRTRALHLALGAALGNSRAERDLRALIEDPKDDTVVPWVAARVALDLDLDGAADLASARLRLARTVSTSSVAHGDWPRRGRVTVTEHVEVIDRLAMRQDPRFALGLLDLQPFARQAAFERLRTATVGFLTCPIVTEAAAGSDEKSIQDAFWALSVLGVACQRPMLALARDPKTPKEVRGMALEHLAMIRDPSIDKDLAASPPDDDIRQARRRARLIQASPDPLGRVDR